MTASFGELISNCIKISFALVLVALVYHAAVRGIKLEEAESALEGDLDLRGFLGISDKVRPGYQEIRVNFKVKTDFSDLEMLKGLIKFSPIYDVVSSGTKVIVQVVNQ